MRTALFVRLLTIPCLALLLAASQAATLRGEQEESDSSADWSQVEQALGRSGQLMPGDVFRIGMPRSDLRVVVEGVPVEPGFALGSYAAFKAMSGDGNAMVMGDLVLLDEELPAVMSGIMQEGLVVTALHNHLNQVSPHVMYMHYTGMGTPVQLATSLHRALSASGTPLDDGGGPATPNPQLDQALIESILGRSGTLNGDVVQFSIPRAETLTENGMELLPAMGVTTAINLQPTADGMAATTGDFVLIASEVNPAAAALGRYGIEVTAIHNHALADEPRLFYMHFWGNDDPSRLAQGLRAALDLTNSRAG